MSKKLPHQLIDSLQNVPGFNEEAFIETHTSGGQVTSVRMNPAKHTEIVTIHSTSEKIPWSTHGYYLNERPSFTLDPLFHAGAYYVQEASSMFLEQALLGSTDLTQPLRILDLCAAPGGKSTLIQSLISKESILVSNEIIKTRANILVENLTKWGGANVVVTNNQPKDFQRLPGFFDVIVVDAPCSGSGLFRKDEDAMAHWSLDSVAMCAGRQKDILHDVLDALKPGGILIYSTCSYSAEENECIADWLVEKQFTSVAIETKENWNIIETCSQDNRAKGYRFYPDKVKGEGFFIAVFKKQTFTESEIRLPKSKLQSITPNELSAIKPVVDTSDLHFVKWEDHILALPRSVFTVLPLLQAKLYIKKAGVNVGSVIRAELIPHHELAMSNLLADAPSVEVDKATALDFLRRKDIEIHTQERGWVCLTFNGTALGWIKNIGSRINNYYPKEWRILNK